MAVREQKSPRTEHEKQEERWRKRAFDLALRIRFALTENPGVHMRLENGSVGSLVWAELTNDERRRVSLCWPGGSLP